MIKHYSIIIISLSILLFFQGQAQTNCPTLPDTIYTQAQDCENNTAFCLPVPIQQFISTDTELTLNGTAYSGSATGCNFDTTIFYNYLSLLGQGNAGPYELVSWTINGNMFSSTFQNIQELVDSMNVWDTNGNWQNMSSGHNIVGGNTSNSYGNMLIEQSQAPGQNANLAANLSQTALGTTIEVGTGTHTLIMTNTAENCADTTVVVMKCMNTLTENINIAIGTQGSYCVNTSELVGSPTSLQLCSNDAENDAVNVSINSTEYCVNYTAAMVGTENVCLVVCDNFGICDTTLLHFTVILSNSVKAENDTVSLAQGESSSFSVSSNDSLSHIASLFISLPPSHGTATVMLDSIITYTPNEGFCGTDTLQYAICDAENCDNATVFINVICSDLKVFTGFSPNDDGVNDRFKIAGIENYPNAKIQVFNVWGNLVYENENSYNNNTGWDGTWEGKYLPDGNYFYIIELNNGSKRRLTGYVLLFR